MNTLLSPLHRVHFISTPQIFIRGSDIILIVVPDMLKKAPIFKRVHNWRKYKGHPPSFASAAHTGQRVAIMRKTTGGGGRGPPGRGGFGGGRGMGGAPRGGFGGPPGMGRGPSPYGPPPGGRMGGAPPQMGGRGPPSGGGGYYGPR